MKRDKFEVVYPVNIMKGELSFVVIQVCVSQFPVIQLGNKSTGRKGPSSGEVFRSYTDRCETACVGIMIVNGLFLLLNL